MTFTELFDLLDTNHFRLVVMEKNSKDPLLDTMGNDYYHYKKYGPLKVIGLDAISEVSEASFITHSVTIRPVIQITLLMEEE